LFEAGNKTALRKCMQRVMDDPKIISEWAANLPSSFDPRPSWLRIENVLGELAASDHAALVEPRVAAKLRTHSFPFAPE
jgi:hypothetical protein